MSQLRGPRRLEHLERDLVDFLAFPRACLNRPGLPQTTPVDETDRMGRASTGAAIASNKEKKNWAHEEHDVFTLAATRAKNRAIADLVGGGEVSGEEIDPQQTSNDVPKPK